MTLQINKKESLASILQAFGVLTIKSARFASTPQSLLPILAYHRISNNTLSPYPFDEEVISASTESFTQQVAFIKNHFDPITFTDLKNAQDKKSPLPDRPLIITFDDGYLDNFLYAFPILKQYGVPATFFVATHYIGTSNIFWWEKVAFWVKQGQIPASSYPSGARLNGENNPARVIRQLKSLEDSARVECLALWEKEYPISHTMQEQIRPMNWDEIRQMSEAGMEIGSHTETHPVLSKLSPDALLYELTQSKKKIETEMNTTPFPSPPMGEGIRTRDVGYRKEVVALAYPGGKPTDHNPIVHQAAEAAGYTFGLTYDGGINRLSDLNRYVLKRIPVERSLSFPLFKSLLLFPRLFSNTRGNG